MTQLTSSSTLMLDGFVMVSSQQVISDCPRLFRLKLETSWNRRPEMVMTNSLLWKITIEIVSFPMKHGDFPQLCQSLPEGKTIFSVIGATFQVLVDWSTGRHPSSNLHPSLDRNLPPMVNCPKIGSPAILFFNKSTWNIQQVLLHKMISACLKNNFISYHIICHIPKQIP